jgi:hypothetical protein
MRKYEYDGLSAKSEDPRIHSLNQFILAYSTWPWNLSYITHIEIEKLVIQASDLLKRQTCASEAEVIFVVTVVHPAMSLVTGVEYDQAKSPIRRWLGSPFPFPPDELLSRVVGFTLPTFV